jgi:hypothetical protein
MALADPHADFLTELLVAGKAPTGVISGRNLGHDKLNHYD